MTVYTPEVSPEPYAKRQFFDCPNCNNPIPVSNNIDCKKCGAFYKLQVKETIKPQ